MSWLRASLFGGGHYGLRRVSPEKAKAVDSERRAMRVPQAAEKVLLACLTTVLAALLIGGGAGLEVRGWLGLLALIGVAQALFLRYLFDFRREVLESLVRTASLAGFTLLSLGALRSFHVFVGLEHVGFLPLSFVSLVMVLVWGRSVAIECTAFAAGLFGLYVFLHTSGGSGEVEGLIVSISGAVVAALTAEYVRRRSTLVRVGLVIGLAQTTVAGTFLLMRPELVDGALALSTLFLLGLQDLLLLHKPRLLQLVLFLPALGQLGDRVVFLTPPQLLLSDRP